MSESVRQAWIALRSSKLRAFLTMLGVIVGVGAMVLMVAIVQGFQTAIHRQFEGLGSRLIFILYQPDESQTGARQKSAGLTLADVRAIPQQCDRVSSVCAEADLGQVKVAYGARERTTRAVGVEPAYQQVRFVRPGRGRFIETQDLEEWRTVCVLGEEIAGELFGRMDPIGRDVTLFGVRLTVVGVLERKGSVFAENFNDRIYVPLTTIHQRMAGSDQVSVIFAQAQSDSVAEMAMNQIWGVLMRRHDNRPDFVVDSQSRVADTLRNVMLAASAVLAGIAGLSLLVGGIGIMNVMLVSVTERTREIGIRKAVGARRRDILYQFLVEAMMLSGVGGVFGIGMGYGGAFLVAAAAGDRLPASVPGWACGLGLVFAMLVGIAAGVYPAFRAARLDPILALRHE